MRIGIDHPKASAMLAGRFRGYSVERLMRFLVALGYDVEIGVKPSKRALAALRVAQGGGQFLSAVPIVASLRSVGNIAARGLLFVYRLVEVMAVDVAPGRIPILRLRNVKNCSTIGTPDHFKFPFRRSIENVSAKFIFTIHDQIVEA